MVPLLVGHLDQRLDGLGAVEAMAREQSTSLCLLVSPARQRLKPKSGQIVRRPTFPAVVLPQCRSDLMVYDLHGNVAERMNLPLAQSQMASRGSREYGHTEMKGRPG